MSTIASLIGRIQDLVHGNGFQVRYIQANEPFAANGPQALPLSPMDRRTVCKVFKLMDEVVKSCQSPRLNLKNSPPFILDLIPDTYSQLLCIFNTNPTILRSNFYLQVYLDNLQAKCKQTLKLFKTTQIYTEGTEERRMLTKLSLIFSHMLFELKAEFPGGVFTGDRFRITKREAEDFWQNNFPKKTIVPWNEFITTLRRTSKKLDMTDGEKRALKNTMDLTGNDHISNFEFDVFTRLFYPWKTLLNNWQLLTTAHPGYVDFLTYDEVKKKLEKLTSHPGSYVFRLSCTRPGQWAIGYVAPDGKIYQTIPQNKSLIQALHEGTKEGFYLYPNGLDKHIDLSSVLDIPQADRVKVTSEQYDLYCEMGTTFELCKICDDRDKNIRIEPCGHLLCIPCLTTWQESENGSTCPFCRSEIKGTHKVVIDRYQPQPKLDDINKAYKARKNIRKDIVSAPLLELPEGPPPPLPPRPANRQSRRDRASAPDPSYVNVAHLEHRPSLPDILAPAIPVDTEYINSDILRDFI